MTRGFVLPPGSGPSDGPGRDRSGFYIGLGVLQMQRREIFNGGTGVAVALQQRVFGAAPFPGALPRRLRKIEKVLIFWECLSYSR